MNQINEEFPEHYLSHFKREEYKIFKKPNKFKMVMMQWITAVCSMMLIFLTLMFFYSLMKHSYNVLLITFALWSVFALPVYMFSRYWFLKKQTSDDIERVSNLLKKEIRPYSFKELAGNLLNTSVRKTIIRLDRVLDTGAFPEYYLNYALEYMMFNRDLDWNELEEQYLADIHKSAYPCIKCGGISFYQRAEKKICKYCDQPLMELSEDEVRVNDKTVKEESELQRNMILKVFIGKLFFLFIYLVLIILLSVSLGGISKEDEDAFAVIVVLVICFIGAFFYLLNSAIITGRVLSDYRALCQLFDKDDRPYPIKEIASEMGVSEAKMMKRIDRVLDHQLLKEMYMNETIGFLLYKDDLKNVRLQYQYLEKYEKISCICAKCGAGNSFWKHQNKICAYCGNPI